MLLSTYNGESFLKEQIDSILSQESIDVYLLIRDDGSTDNTCRIIEEYAESYRNVKYCKGNNIGFVNSFSQLARQALDCRLQPDFYAFADQDDIWMPNKLYQACVELNKKDSLLPNLFTSNSILIDAFGKEIGIFHKERPIYSKGNILLYNTEQGCSMIFNKQALELYCQYPPKKSFHDRYMCMICFLLGTASYCHTPLFYYRLHGNNALGLENKSLANSGFAKFCNFIKYIFSEQLTSNYRLMASEFYDNYKEFLSFENSTIVKDYIDYRNGLINRFKLLKIEYNHPCYLYFGLKTKIIHVLEVLFLKY